MIGADAAPASLYRSVIGDDFDRLPDSLRQFHELPHGGRATGHFEIERGASMLARLVALLLRLPLAGTDIPLKLDVAVDGLRERWVRDFAGRCLNSTQWTRNGMLIERVGLGQFGFDLVADDDGLRFVSKRLWLLSIPVPSFLSPRITATAVAVEQGWRVAMTMTLPWGALLLRYDGNVIPEQD